MFDLNISYIQISNIERKAIISFKIWFIHTVHNFCRSGGSINFENMVVLCKYHTYDAMPLYLGVFVHTFVHVLTKIRKKWRPHVKLYRTVCINNNVLHNVHVISWKNIYVGSHLTSKTLKH